MATFLGLLAIFMWGSLALLGASTRQIPAFQLLFLCFIVSSMLMLIKRAVTKQGLFTKPALTHKQWLIGIVGLFGFHYCYFMALKIAPAIEVSLISYLWPMLLALLLSSKTNFLRTLIGGLLGFIGVTLVITGDTELSLNNKYVTGYVLAACCALIWSSYSWSLTRSKSNIDDVGWLSFAVALLSLIAHIQLEQTHWQLSTQQWLGVLLLGLGPVGGAFYLWEFGIKRGDKKLLASMSFAAPLISTLLLSLTGQGTWSPNLLFAVILILLGAIVSNSNQKQASNNLPN